MPAPRMQPTRSSQRRNSQQDDTPARTRPVRGKTAPSKAEQQKIGALPTESTSQNLAPTRKQTRSSNARNQSFDIGPDIYASYDEGVLTVFGLSREFFSKLKKHYGRLPKDRDLSASGLEYSSPPSEQEATSEDDAEDSEDELPSSRKRNRAGRGVRTGRAKANRTTTKGNRARVFAATNVSPVRSRPSRNAAPAFPLIEDDDEISSNQVSPMVSTKPSPFPNREDYKPNGPPSINENGEHFENHDTVEPSRENGDLMEDVLIHNATPVGTPLDDPIHPVIQDDLRMRTPSIESKATAKLKMHLPIPKIALSLKSGSNTPAVSTPAESTVPKLLEPEEDELSDSDLPEPWISDAPSPVAANCEDQADYLLQKRYKPLVDVQDVIASLTKYSASQRSTESLYAMAENTQKILRVWQDEYLKLDARTAPHMHPAKKAANGGRIPFVPQVFEDMKEADLYGYTYDGRKMPGCQDPWAQRPGAEKSSGRELRTRRARDMLDSAAPSEEEEDEDNDSRPSKRQRRATRKFDVVDASTGSKSPKKYTGWGGARKKGVSRFLKPASETPEPEGPPFKRQKAATSNIIHPRIQEMREVSIVPSSGDEGSSAMEVDDMSDTQPKRGRPAGSKNSARRSDFGIKKGPRKKPSEAGTPAPSTPGPSDQPATLQSMSDGQGQFSVDTRVPAGGVYATANTPETVFEAVVQQPITQESPLLQPSNVCAPDVYLNTTPLSQYTNPDVDDGILAGGSRKKPKAKSEKRSQAMTIWWAGRKARKCEMDEKNGISTKPSSRSNSNGRKGRQSSTGSTTGTTPQPAPTKPQIASPNTHTEPYPQEPYPTTTYPPPLQARPTPYGYPQPPQSHSMMLSYTPLAALPSNPYPPYSSPPILAPSAQLGPRTLAPAPLPLQHPPTYPSPYGPQSPIAPARPRSSGQQQRSGPPPLAPAPPQHYSPYAPPGLDRPFKVMIQGSGQVDGRRESR